MKNGIYEETVIEAVKTGFLFGRSLNFYEDHNTRDELIEQGYSEIQVQIANRVLAHFDTSLGAKLGRCPEELWTVAECADCVAPVDTRKINSAPLYGVFLCRPCKNERDTKRKCFKCGSRTEDPAEDFPPVNKHYVGRDESKKDRYEYVCTWCALALGSKDFLRKRGGTDREPEDLNVLIQQMRLVRGGEPASFPTAQKMREVQEQVEHFKWYFESEQGKSFGRKWKEYHISFTGILWRAFKEPPGPDFNPYPFTGLLMKDKNDPRRLYWICRVRIRYKHSLVFLEIRDGLTLKPEIEIRNIRPVAKDDEIFKLWEARKLFFRIEEKFGRPASLPQHLEDLLTDYLYIRAIFQYKDGRNPKQNEIADFYGVHRSHFSRHCRNKLRKPWPEIISLAEKSLQAIPLSEIPSRYKRVYGLPHSESRKSPRDH
jgi:hypothetical protein